MNRSNEDLLLACITHFKHISKVFDVPLPTKLMEELYDTYLNEQIKRIKNQPLEIAVTDIINEYSAAGIYIEIIADGYKTEHGICWRGYVHWKEDGEWLEEDCGSYLEWIDAFNNVLTWIKMFRIN
jgi:hypothetical protein